MRRAAAASVAALLVLLAGCADTTTTSSSGGGGSSAASGEAATGDLPPLTLDAFGSDAEPLDLGSLEGPAVINLWASWCTQCVDELPVLQDFSEQYSGRVAVIGVDFQDAQGEAAQRMIEDAGVTYPLYEDFDGDLNAAAPFPRLRGLPFTALVDADGRVVHQEFGAVDDVAELEDLVREHLGVGA